MLAGVVDVLRAEGWRAVVDRARDRWRASQWRSTFPAAGSDDALHAPVLNLTGLPASALHGDAARHLMARLRAESTQRAVALVSPLDATLRLDWWTSEARFGLQYGRRWSGDPLDRDRDWEVAVMRAVERTSPRVIHVEGVTGLSLPSLLAIADLGLPLVLSIHDFGVFCRRPHLWMPSGRFCAFCTDDPTCRGCLDDAGDRRRFNQSEHRHLAYEIATRAAAVVCPSEYARAEVARLFPSLAPGGIYLIPPGIDPPDLDRRSRRDPKQVALVSGLPPHAGGAAAGDAIQEIVARGVDVTIYGGNGHEHLRALRHRAGVTIRGYYAAGSLPSLLVRQHASVAIVIPRVPGTDSLVLSESWAAGVPVVATRIGALAERVTSGGGSLVDPDADPDVVADAVDELRERSVAVPQPFLARQTAEAHTSLYLSILGAAG
ncbi:MAG TPA: glycosyltransferase [Vicinamibacterales bacterium]|nr:glycosyltransferase [Vicinamibacterales bacterium]